MPGERPLVHFDAEPGLGGQRIVAVDRGRTGVRVVVPAHAALVDRAAQQIVDRPAEHFAAYVPERLVDAGDRRPQHRAHSVEPVDVIDCQLCSTC
jgi:hypothetical protein